MNWLLEMNWTELNWLGWFFDAHHLNVSDVIESLAVWWYYKAKSKPKTERKKERTPKTVRTW